MILRIAIPEPGPGEPFITVEVDPAGADPAKGCYPRDRYVPETTP